MPIMDKLVEHIHKRIEYIHKKLPCCWGYSNNYKAVREEELREILKWIEENRKEEN